MALAMAFIAAPAVAQTIALGPEEAVTVRMDESGRSAAAVADRRQAAWTEFDLAVARNFVRGEYDAGVGPNSVPTLEGSGLPDSPAIVPNQVRMRFMHIAGRHALLIVENGYDRALVYRAHITLNGETRPTDVCVVLPNGRSSEHWPAPLGRISLSDLRLEEWQEGQPPTCE